MKILTSLVCVLVCVTVSSCNGLGSPQPALPVTESNSDDYEFLLKELIVNRADIDALLEALTLNMEWTLITQAELTCDRMRTANIAWKHTSNYHNKNEHEVDALMKANRDHCEDELDEALKGVTNPDARKYLEKLRYNYRTHTHYRY